MFNALGAIIATVITAVILNSPVEAAARRLAANDTIQIRVVGQPELDTQVRIESDGTIALPYIGRIKAAGLTNDGLAGRVKRDLEAANAATNPDVIVTVVGFGAQVSIQGSVNAPGIIPLDRPTTLLQALSRAGGMKPDAGEVTVRRQGPSGPIVARLNPKAVLKGNVNEKDLYVQNNDDIYVDEAAVYFLYGYVNRPGQYPLVRRLTVMQALAVGGGISELGTEWFIRIRRRQPDGRLADHWASINDEVEPSDTIIVSERLF